MRHQWIVSPDLVLSAAEAARVFDRGEAVIKKVRITDWNDCICNHCDVAYFRERRLEKCPGDTGHVYNHQPWEEE